MRAHRKAGQGLYPWPSLSVLGRSSQNRPSSNYHRPHGVSLYSHGEMTSLQQQIKFMPLLVGDYYTLAKQY